MLQQKCCHYTVPQYNHSVPIPATNAVFWEEFVPTAIVVYRGFLLTCTDSD